MPRPDFSERYKERSADSKRTTQWDNLGKDVPFSGRKERATTNYEDYEITDDDYDIHPPILSANRAETKVNDANKTEQAVLDEKILQLKQKIQESGVTNLENLPPEIIKEMQELTSQKKQLEWKREEEARQLEKAKALAKTVDEMDLPGMRVSNKTADEELKKRIIQQTSPTQPQPSPSPTKKSFFGRFGRK